MYSTKKNYKKSDIRICPQNIKIELNLLVLTLQDHWLESTFCKLGVPSSMFSQCPILGLSKFPPDHQSFAKGTLSLQEHKNTQGFRQSLVIQSNLNYKKKIFQSNELLRDTKTCHTIELELKKQSYNPTNYSGTPRPSTPRESPSALVGTKK